MALLNVCGILTALTLQAFYAESRPALGCGGCPEYESCGGGFGGFGGYGGVGGFGGGCGPIAPSPPISFLPVPQPLPIRVPSPPRQSVTIPNIILALLPPNNKPPCAPRPVIRPSPVVVPLPQPYPVPIRECGGYQSNCGCGC